MKRLLDIVLSVAGLVMLLPLYLLVALLVWIKLGRPIYFRQERAGKDGRPFEMLKFRTMLPMQPDTAIATDDGKRMTAFGSRLRALSLDELPELWNVLKGDMSLVGPRPLLLDYLPLYSEVQRRRQDVRPGITGWAQVNGRNALQWEERFELDVWYVENRSIWLDLRILAMTVMAVIRRDGISGEGVTTMKRFEGSSTGSERR